MTKENRCCFIIEISYTALYWKSGSLC